MKTITTLFAIALLSSLMASAQNQGSNSGYRDNIPAVQIQSGEQTLLEPDNKANRSNFAPINLIPAHGSTGVGLRSNLQITYDRDVFAQPGYSIIIEYTHPVYWETVIHETIPACSVTISGGVVIIDPIHEFDLSIQYRVFFPAGTFGDGDGNQSIGYGWTNLWHFTTTNSDLSANFEADETFGGTPMTVNFTDISNIHTAPITEWTWDFGDGAGSTDQHPVHTYQHTGSDLESYTVTLMVRDANDSVSVRIKENYINVCPPNYFPGGNVSGVWTAANSPYFIGGQIIVPFGDTLIIEPGVSVKFKTNSTNSYFPEDVDFGYMTVYGTLIAQGTETDSIYFTRAGDQGYWGIIHMKDHANSENALEYLKIEHAGNTWTEWGVHQLDGLVFHNFDGIVRNSSFSNNRLYCITSISSNTTVAHNTFFGGGVRATGQSSTLHIHDNSFFGGSIQSYVGSTTVIENNFIENAIDGIKVGETNDGIINNNIITGCHRGIYVQSVTGCLVLNNIITSNNDAGIVVWGALNTTISHNIIASNNDGIRREHTNSFLQLINNTIYGNNRGVNLNHNSITLAIKNSIIHGNTTANAFPPNTTITYSCIQGGFAGVGNTSANPMLDGDFIPVWTNYPDTTNATQMSPCIDRGNPLNWLTNPEDRDPDGSRMDMGARHFHQHVSVTVYNNSDPQSPEYKFYDFGNVYIPGTSQPKSFSIKNEANHFVDCPVFLAGQNPDQFHLVNQADTLKHLEPFQVVQVPVVFQPTKAQNQLADFTAGISGQFTDSLRVKGFGLTSGSIVGNVKTPTGHGVEGVTITLVQTGTKENSRQEPIKSLTRITDADGYYGFMNIGAGIFSLTPYFLDDNGILHQFDPPVHNNVAVNLYSVVERNFTDISFFTVSGSIHYLNTTCPVEGIQIFMDNLPAAITGENGEFIIEDVQIGSHTFRPDTTGGRSFQPPFISQMIMGPVTGLYFEDKFTYNLSGYVSGGCLVPLADSVRLIVSCLSNCGITDTIYTDANGFYSINLAPLEYSVAVETINYYGTEIIFDTKQADLSTGDLTLDFVYRSPPFVKIKGFELFTNEHDWIILEQFETYEIEIDVYERYGEFGEIICRIDSGNITVYDYLSDIGEVEIVIDDSLTIYSFVAGTPNIAAWGPHPYQKLIQAGYENPEGLYVLADKWVYITGIKPRGTAYATTTPEIPLLILRDPPGGNSYSYFSQTETFSQAMSFLMGVGTQVGVYRTAHLGLTFSMSTGFGVSVGTEIARTLDFETGTNVSMTQNTVKENQFTFSTSQTYATSGDENFVGRKADLYMGGAMNVLYGITDILTIEDNEVSITQDIIIVPEGFATTYVYTENHIQNVVIPSLHLIQDTVSAQRWESFIALNQSLKDQAVLKDTWTLAAGTGQLHTQVLSKSSTHTQEFELTIEAYVAIQAGLRVSGIGATGGVRVSSAISLGVSQTNIVANTTEIGYYLYDNNPGDHFLVDVKEDPVYGTPVFQTVSGESMCPHEENTTPRQGCLLTPNLASAHNVDPGLPAIFDLTMVNTSQTYETWPYTLRLLNETNPHGAYVTASGVSLTTGIVYNLDPNVPETVTIYISRPPGIVYDIKGITLELSAQCESGPGFSDKAVFDVFFTPPCSQVSIIAPGNNWIVNQACNNILQIEIDDIDLENTQLQSISLEYSPGLSGSTWIEIYSIPKNSINTLPLVVDLDVSVLEDGDYRLRAVAKCAGNIKNYSQRLTGVINRSAPQLLGIPQPSDGVLSIGDEISFTFNKALLPASVTINSCIITDVETGNQIAASVQYSQAQNKIVFTINPGLSYFIENRYLKSQVFDITDRFGNPLADTLSWTFLVDQGPLHWNPDNFQFTIPEAQPISFNATLSNVSSKQVYFLLQMPEWLNATPSEGYLNASGGSVVINFQSDTLSSGLYADNISAITLGYPGEIISVNVLNTSVPVLSVIPSAQDVPAAAGTVDFNLISTVDWSVSDNAPWFSVSPMDGTGSSLLTVSYDENTSLSQRNGHFTISSTGLPDVDALVIQHGVVIPAQHLVEGNVQSGEIECYNASQTITVQNYIIESNGIINMVAGQNIIMLSGTHAKSGSYLHAWISATDHCGIITPPALPAAKDETLIAAEEQQATQKASFFKVYPNPTTGMFTLELNEVDEVATVIVEIYSMLGEKLLHTELPAMNHYQFNLADRQRGMYLVRVTRGENIGFVKMIKQ